MMHSAGPEVEKLATVHSSHVTVVIVVVDLEMSDQLNEEVVAEQAVLMEGTLVSVNGMLGFEGVVVETVATVEVIEEASAMEAFAGQLEQLVV